MAIISKNDGKVTVLYAGRVVEIKHFSARRNLSDTLDYTDFQTVDCTSALVYHGRKVDGTGVWGDEYINGRMYKKGDELPIEARFGWLDCSNLFVWRGSPELTPEVDEDATDDKELAEDLIAWRAHHETLDRFAAEQVRKDEEKARLYREEQERNKPVVGKKMKVFKGRKVKPGLEGTVAFISQRTGGVLLKDHDKWRDRNAPGVWVNPEHLKAV